MNGPRHGRSGRAGRRLLGLNNIELITDRPLQTNLVEIKVVKWDWPDRALVEEPCWVAILKKVEETGADGVELGAWS